MFLLVRGGFWWLLVYDLIFLWCPFGEVENVGE